MTTSSENADVEVRALTARDDLDAQVDLSERAFGVRSADDRAHWRRVTASVISNGAYFGAFAGRRALGAAGFFDMRQWWCGRAVPMAGVTSVKVAPEERGRGIGRRMMARVLDDIATRGFPLSVLYPATMPLYRSLGWELAGGRYSAVIPARSLRTMMPADPAAGGSGPALSGSAQPTVRRAEPADAQAIVDVISRVHEAARDSGPVTWSTAAMAAELMRPGFYSYLCDDGFTRYRWENGNEDLFVGGVQAVSAVALRGLWSVIASHASIAKSVQVWTSPADPLWWLTQERDANVRSRSMWMLRVVDAPAAIAARGFPPSVVLDLPLLIEDRSRPANSGHWTLTVAGGKGELVPAAAGGPGKSDTAAGGPGKSDTAAGGPGQFGKADGETAALTLGARGLAALYAGAPVASLRLVGLAAGGDPGADALLDAAFAANPYMLDAF